jgi:hypothetical protein
MSPQYKNFRQMLRAAGMEVRTLGQKEMDIIAVSRPNKPPRNREPISDRRNPRRNSKRRRQMAALFGAQPWKLLQMRFPVSLGARDGVCLFSAFAAGQRHVDTHSANL